LLHFGGTLNMHDTSMYAFGGQPSHALSMSSRRREDLARPD
jgi:hypothetical protein